MPGSTWGDALGTPTDPIAAITESTTGTTGGGAPTRLRERRPSDRVRVSRPGSRLADPVRAAEAHDPVLRTALRILETAPRGATRRDLISALKLPAARWRGVRDALLDSGLAVLRGRGPGLRLVHIDHASSSAPCLPARDLDRARTRLASLVAATQEFDSRVAQEVTGLDADAVRRLLKELVDQGALARVGAKRCTRYRRITD